MLNDGQSYLFSIEIQWTTTCKYSFCAVQLCQLNYIPIYVQLARLFLISVFLLLQNCKAEAPCCTYRVDRSSLISGHSANIYIKPATLRSLLTQRTLSAARSRSLSDRFYRTCIFDRSSQGYKNVSLQSFLSVLSTHPLASNVCISSMAKTRHTLKCFMSMPRGFSLLLYGLLSPENITEAIYKYIIY